jgi:hypothetical protein
MSLAPSFFAGYAAGLDGDGSFSSFQPIIQTASRREKTPNHTPTVAEICNCATLKLRQVEEFNRERLLLKYQRGMTEFVLRLLKENEMSIERYLRLIAGSFVLASLLLGYFHSPYWFLFTGFVGLNLIQSAFTNWCPMISFLLWLGAKSDAAPVSRSSGV